MKISRISTRRNFITLAVTIAMAGLFCYGGCKGGEKAPPGPPPPTEVMVVTMELRQVTLTTELPGRTSPYLVANIRPQVNGHIQSRFFEEGSDVEAGEVLYQIDPAPLEAALSSAKAALARSEAGITAVRARAERCEKLLESGSISRQEYDDIAATLNQNEADIEYWEGMVETARINLEYASVTAPISGRIGRSNVTEGAIVTAYQPLPLATIQQLDPIYVDLQQSSTELLSLKRRLEEGRLNMDGSDRQNVKLVMPDGSPYPLEGTFQFRDITVEASTGSVTVRVVFPNPKGLLLPGMFVRAIVMEGVNEKAILIPQQAVSRDPKGSPYVLTVDAEEIVQVRPLVLERAMGDQWLVGSGLEPGDRVIVEGLLKVRPGSKVKAVESVAPDDSVPAEENEILETPDEDAPSNSVLDDDFPADGVSDELEGDSEFPQEK